MSDTTKEHTFQTDILEQLEANGWLVGSPDRYNRELALYPEDLLGFVQETQDAQWQKFCSLYPNDTEQKFLERVAAQFNKADPNAPNSEMRERRGQCDTGSAPSREICPRDLRLARASKLSSMSYESFILLSRIPV